VVCEVSVRDLYIKYMQQGLSRKEAAKMVQMTTGLSAVSGKPIRKKQREDVPQGTYQGQYTF
jgi:hypothetical protein